MIINEFKNIDSHISNSIKSNLKVYCIANKSKHTIEINISIDKLYF